MAQQGAVAIARPPRARAYAQARRHSLRVRFLRRVIPIGTAVAVGLVLFVTLADPFGRVGGLTLGPISLSGTKITMENPRLSGFRNDARPYEVTATAAMQDVRKPTVVELKEMKARMVIDDRGGAAQLEAAAGVFDTNKEQLELREDIRVKTDAGHDARLRSASIDFKAGTVVSREPVTVTFPNGIIEAQALEITDNGRIIAFTGRVRTVLEGATASSATGSIAEDAAVPSPAPRTLAQPAALSYEVQPARLRP